VTLAEIPYPRIDPDIVQLGPVTVRWYGVSYILAFVLAYLVLRDLARRGRWPVAPERVADVLFWGILGVFFGGRIGWVLFYGIPGGSVRTIWDAVTVWKGGMSFHGGLIGVIVAYWVYTKVKNLPRGAFFDGLTLATPLGILCVRLANFINAELPGRPWNGPWAMRFPQYTGNGFESPEAWRAAYAANPNDPRLFTQLVHPSQLYEALGEGVLLFLVLRWLMLRKGLGGGRVAASFLVGYGVIRFALEFFREPDRDMGYVFLDTFTKGQVLSAFMVAAGVLTFVVCAVKASRQRSRPSA
jgi:phosphatidylglycerol:prolipoprotein diacylglycerol transferase